jgi:hypothetical protein
MARTLSVYIALASAALVLGCGSKKPPKPPEPTIAEPPPELAERAPPPKKKKCEALDEGCKALAGVKARVAHAAFTIEPAQGWTYAQLPAATVAQASESGPCLVVVALEGVDPKKDAQAREAALDAAAKEAGVALPKKKVGWKKPDDKKDAHGLKVRLWQLDGATRGEKKGPLLVFDATSADGKPALLGVGFVPSDDSSAADEAIMSSIMSIEAAQ